MNKSKGSGIGQVATRLLSGICKCPIPAPPGFVYVEIKMDGKKNVTDAYPANRRLEEAYRHYFTGRTILTDSMLEKGGIVGSERRTELPRGGDLSAEDRKFFNKFLKDFQGYPSERRKDEGDRVRSVFDLLHKKLKETLTNLDADDLRRFSEAFDQFLVKFMTNPKEMTQDDAVIVEDTFDYFLSKFAKAHPLAKSMEDFLKRYRKWAKNLVDARQLAPDIMDFSKRLMYEIKTDSGREEGVRALYEDYKLANTICREHPQYQWHQKNIVWKPDHIYNFPGSKLRYICTGLTDYNQTSDIDGSEEEHRGLIIYRVFELRKVKEEKTRKAAAMALPVPKIQEEEEEKKPRKRVRIKAQTQVQGLEVEPDFLRRLQEELDRTIGSAPEGTDYRIIVPHVFYKRYVLQPMMQRKIDMLPKGQTARTNPVMAFRELNLAVGVVVAAVGVAAATVIVCIYAAPLAAGGAAVEASAAAGVAAAAESTAMVVTAEKVGEVVFLNAVKKVVTSESAQTWAKAAAVLLVVGTVKSAEASAEIVELQPVLAIPATELTGTGDDEAEVMYQGKKYYQIVSAIAGD